MLTIWFLLTVTCIKMNNFIHHDRLLTFTPLQAKVIDKTNVNLQPFYHLYENYLYSAFSREFHNSYRYLLTISLSKCYWETLLNSMIQYPKNHVTLDTIVIITT